MDKKECKTCGHKKQRHCGCHKHSHVHNKRCKCKNKHHCRKDLCGDDFRLRLGGLQNGLGFRLRQLMGCEVKIELENGKELHGKICYVGSNFVELLEREPKTPPPILEEDNNAEIEKEDINENEEENKVEKESYPINTDYPHQKKCNTIIFPIDKINNLKLRCGCRRRCNC